MRKWGWLVGAALMVAPAVHAKDKAPDEETKAEATLNDFVKDFERSDGLFPLYRDKKTGELFMEIDADRLGREFIYFTYTENGPVETGHFRGNFRDNRIVVFNRVYDRIEVEAVNTSYYFDPRNALARSSDANIARAPLGSVEIKAKSEDGKRFLISADALLEGEALHRISPWQSPDAKPGSSFALGELSKEKTRITAARSFPENTDIRVEYVYDNPKPVNYGSPDVTDPRSVAVLVQHSFLAMPAPGFEPRADDFRVGYFTSQATDLTSKEHAPYRDLIHRWRLVKKNPEAALSDPVKPITFWIENTTPVELRDTIRNATLAWNAAFEKAGFTNAVEVRIQPDDADWEAGDLRYNVLRWTSSPNPPFGGYGPSFVNPRTGEIMGADIMLEYVFLTNRLRYKEIFETAALPAEMKPAGTAHHHGPGEGPACDFGSLLQPRLMTARAVLLAQGAPPEAFASLVEQELYYLVLHEVGHTLGLNHNMRSSSSVPFASLSSTETTPVNSVMDYPAINIARVGEPQGQFSAHRPGPYDLWAIEYGYTTDTGALGRILARSTEPALAFGNDADDMRAPGVHIDPRVMIGDLSDDPIGWAGKQSQLINQTFAALPGKVLKAGDSYQALLDSYFILTGQQATAASVASRWIGGVFNNRSAVGQAGAQKPLAPVPVADQRRALATVTAIAFAPDAFAASESLLDRLQVQRRSFDSFGINVDPKPHARALAIQRSLLDHMLHPNVLTRLTDSRRYGGEYPVSTYMGELTAAIFDADRAGPVNTYRQNLQIEYVTRLIAAASGAGGGAESTPFGPAPLPNYDYVARSAALASIEKVKTIAALPAADAETRAHRAHIRSLIAAFERR
ncbi:MAG: zinc-dependent metalloprotease [Erythrobacter sp.]